MTKLDIGRAKPETLRKFGQAQLDLWGTFSREAYKRFYEVRDELRAEFTVAPLRTRAAVALEALALLKRYRSRHPGYENFAALTQEEDVELCRLCAEPTAEAEEGEPGEPPGYQELCELREFQRQTRGLLQSEELDSFQTCLAIAELLPDDGETSATDKAFGSVPAMPFADPDPAEARCGCAPSAELEREVERLRAALFKVGSALVEAHKITFEAAK
jgi:hypothetical protein